MLNQNTSSKHRQNNPQGRYYLGFCYRGDSQKLIQDISKKINEYDLCKLIPLLRVEKKDKNQKRGEFYFFLAIDGVDDPQLETKYRDFQDKILVLPYFHRAVKESTFTYEEIKKFTYEDIKKMVGNDHYFEDYTNPIPYQKNQEKEIEINPFTFDCTPDYPVDESQEKKYQNLLYWLSAIGKCSLQLFKQTCDSLALEHPQRIIRKLKLLGHIETSPDCKKCFVNPPIIIKINSDLEQAKYILCGQRNKQLISILKNYGEITYSSQPLKNAPHVIQIKFDPCFDVKDIIEEIEKNNRIKIYYADSTIDKLAENLPDFAQWSENLPTIQGIVRSSYDWKYLDLVNNDFIDCSNPDQTGLYQMFRDQDRNQENSMRKPIRPLFYDQDEQCFKDGDWYGLRFLTLKKNHENISLQYDVNNRRLAIPYHQRWPELYERFLVLASGILPSYCKTQDDSWLIYENISLELLQQLANKLDLNWEEKHNV